MKDFAKQAGLQEMDNEMVSDAFEMAEGAEVAADADEVYNGILGEIGLQGAGQIGNNVGVGAIASQAQPQAQVIGASSEEQDAMAARLAALGQ